MRSLVTAPATRLDLAFTRRKAREQEPIEGLYHHLFRGSWARSLEGDLAACGWSIRPGNLIIHCFDAVGRVVDFRSREQGLESFE